MDRPSFHLIGYDCPTGSYPSPLVPIVRDFEGSYKAIYLDTKSKLSIDPVYSSSEFIKLADVDVSVREKLQNFDYSKHKLFAVAENDLHLYEASHELNFFTELLQDKNFAAQKPYIRVSLAEDIGDDIILRKELENYSQYNQIFDQEKRTLNIFEENYVSSFQSSQTSQNLLSVRKNKNSRLNFMNSEEDLGQEYGKDFYLDEESKKYLEIIHQKYDLDYDDIIDKVLHKQIIPSSFNKENSFSLGNDVDRQEWLEYLGEQAKKEKLNIKNKSRPIVTEVLLHEDGRKAIDGIISGTLAFALWIILGITVLWNVGMSAYISIQLLNVSENNLDESEIDLILQRADKSFVIVSDTSKSLYSVILPIAATVTTFYFGTQQKEKKIRKVAK